MSALISLLAAGGNGLVVIALLIAAFFCGRTLGRQQRKAQADIAAMKVASQQVAEVARQQASNREKVNLVHQNNAALTDDAQRQRLRESVFHHRD